MKKILLLMAIFFSVLLQAQLNTLSMNLPQGHPRYLTDAGGKETTLKLISNEPWAEEVFGKLKSKDGCLCPVDRSTAGMVAFATCHVLEIACHGCICKR